MRWTNLFVLAEVFGLACLCSGHATALAKETALVQRQTPSENRPFVFRGDNRSPREIRDAGGFRPQGDGWEHDESSYILDHHYHAGPQGCGEDGGVFRTAYVSLAQERETAERYGRWLYEVRATPNILDSEGRYPETEVMALGGIHWRQVRRYVLMPADPEELIDEGSWIENPEYDRATYDEGPDAFRARVNVDFPYGLRDGELDSDSDDSEDEGDGPQRPLFAVVDRFMDSTPGMYELYGGFPPTFQQYAPRDDIPGSGQTQPAQEPQVSYDEAAAMLNHYINSLPSVDQALQDLLRDIDRAACPSFIAPGSFFGRHRRAAIVEAHSAAPSVDIQNSEQCVLGSLRAEVRLHNWDWAGSSDRLFLEIGKNSKYDGQQPHYKLKDSPSAGDTMPFTIDIADAFGTNLVTLDKIQYVRLVSRTDNGGVGSNELALKGFTAEDWSWGRDCDKFKSIDFEWHLSSALSAGTSDDLIITKERNHPINQEPASGLIFTHRPKLGTSGKAGLNLTALYGTETVPIGKVNYLQIMSYEGISHESEDQWKWGGAKFTAICAESGKKAILNKFESDYYWHYRTYPVEMPIKVHDWKWEDENLQGNHPFPRDAPKCLHHPPHPKSGASLATPPTPPIHYKQARHLLQPRAVHTSSLLQTKTQTSPNLRRFFHSQAPKMAPIPATMKAISITKNGGPEVLEYTDVPVPVPQPDEILVRNHVAGVNFIDTYFRSGQYPSPTFPRILGQDAAGEVVAVGPAAAVPHIPGSTVVFMNGTGTYAEYSTVKASAAVALPEGVAREDAVAAYLQGLTAWTFIRRAGLTQPGEWAFVHAAAGGVGSLLVQLLKRVVGARVIATASSPEKRKIVEGLGADYALDSNEDWVARVQEITGGHGVDSIYDGVGKATFHKDLEMIAVGGSLVMLGNASGNVEPFDIRPTLGPKNVRLSRPILFGYLTEREALEKYAGELFEFIRSGKVKVLHHATYDLKDTAKAHADIESRKTTGKLLIKIN
ncbi:quinone oxidoreductase [Cordyceps fumosorosea ARSEF 2679]|uniref:Quinone oxidoreductase n=1 Tax=Cordyceps fumosorosea (strain ARSEF 2679) TaxID=1081104 RepID=A0A167Y9P1_CORFA|nr:quinone oxidoreductase [Cordyceps fumosorosea ARSEF 2679]OAA66027.1 quinone oxidoreductase [Cordyceps fumosorosea ARSEF 2679]